MHRRALILVSLLYLGCDCSASPEPLRDGGGGGVDTGPIDQGDASGGGDGGADAGNTGVEGCGDGLDDDGDGAVDEGCQCNPGADQECYGGDRDLAGVGACTLGVQHCNTSFEFGAWDACIGWGEPTAEACDGVDNDCDGDTDEGCDCTPGEERLCYDGPAITEGVGSCTAGRITCVETSSGSMWSGCVGSVGPADEVCDGAGDEDCDERIDEGCDCPLGDSQSCYGGPPGTAGVGACAAGSQTCVAGSGGSVGWGACTGETRPTAEVCTSGVDEDCDGLTDCADPDCGASCCTPWGEDVPIVPAEGEIMFLVDRSGSMDWPAVMTTATRWQELDAAMTTVLPQLTDLYLGMLTFPEMDGTSESLNCDVASSPDVPLALGSGPAILSRLIAADPRGGDTPTPQAFGSAELYLASVPTTRERFVILATDGLPEPNCGATVSATVAAIADLRTTYGIDTFVLGIVGPDLDGDTSGIPALQDALNQMADAGGRARPGAIRYYEAGDEAALTSALEAIVASATNCRFELVTPPPRPSDVEVRLDGALIPASGWTLSGTTLEFLGAYCDQIQAGVVGTISARDDC